MWTPIARQDSAPAGASDALVADDLAQHSSSPRERECVAHVSVLGSLLSAKHPTLRDGPKHPTLRVIVQ